MSERRPKKRPNVFAQVVANADEVVQASFIASAPAPDKADTPATDAAFSPATPDGAPPPATEGSPIRVPVADNASTAVSVPKPTPEPASTAVVPPVPPLPEAAESGSTNEAVAFPLVDDRPMVVIESPEGQLAPAAIRGRARGPRASAPAQTAGDRDVVSPPTSGARPGPAPRRLPITAHTGEPQHWSHQAVFQSFASATIESKNWRLHGFRIVPDVLAGLKTRINADRRSTGNVKLAISHYIDAALRHASTDVDEQVSLAQEFLTARMGMVEAGKQSTYRVGPQASEWVADLNVGLQEADYGRKGIYVVSASIESFLDALNGAGTLQRPELPGMR